MEHGIAAFIDSQNRVNTFVNYATTREWKTSSGRGKKEKKNWKKRKYDMAQIVSIDQWEEKRMVASTTARLSFVVGHRSFFGDTQKILQSTQTHAHIDAGRSVYIRKRCGYAARRHAYSTHVPASRLWYSMFVQLRATRFGPDAHRIKVHYDNHIRYGDAGHIPY